MSSRWTSCWTSIGLQGFGFNGNLTILDQKSSGSAPAFATGVRADQLQRDGLLRP